MKKISKIRELALIICVLVLMNGIVSYAKTETVALHADEKSASSAYVTVPDNDIITVWGSVSSVSDYQVEFIVPDGLRTAYKDSHDPGTTFSPETRFAINVVSTNVNLYGNSKDDQKKGCIASGGIAN